MSVKCRQRRSHCALYRSSIAAVDATTCKRQTSEHYPSSCHQVVIQVHLWHGSYGNPQLWLTCTTCLLGTELSPHNIILLCLSEAAQPVVLCSVCLPAYSAIAVMSWWVSYVVMFMPQSLLMLSISRPVVLAWDHACAVKRCCWVVM